MKNRLLLTLFTLCMMLFLLPETARAADITYPVTGGNIYFDVTTGTITSCDSGVTEAVIPSEIYSVPVTSIGDRAFYQCFSLTSVTIPEGAISIGDFAFWACRNLTHVTIPDSITSIGQYAFEGCALTSVTIPQNITSIGEGVFRGCGMTSVIIPNRVTSIGMWAFSQCGNLTDVTIPDSVTSIGDGAFQLCSSLTGVTIPDSITTIEHNTFASCLSLTSVTIPDSVTSIGSNAFSHCRSLTSVTIPEGVASIETEAFDSCSSMTSVIIPASVTSISRAFSDCSSLTDVYYGGNVFDWAEVIVGDNTLREAAIHFNAHPIILDPNGGSVSTPVAITGEDGTLSDLPIPTREGYTFDGWYTNAAGGTEVTTKTVFTEKTTVYAHWTVAFTDVPAGIYYAVPVSWAVRNGITDGTGNNAFSPNMECTRAQIITFLWRAYGSLEPTVYSSPFADVTDAGAYYYKAILWAAEKGITANAGLSADAFGPDTPCTRAQAVTFMYRAAGSPSVSGTSSFSDVGASSYYKDAVTWAVTNGITNGVGDNQFSPDTICNRAQIVTFLWRGLAE